jgi:large subunit ribosomal protein L2
MGKRIISQARGKGSLTYRVKKKAFSKKIKYPMKEGEAEIIKLIHSAGHTAPLMKVEIDKEIFFNPAFLGAFEGQKIEIGSSEAKEGNVLFISDVPLGTKVYNIEKNPGDGGKMMRAAGSSAVIFKKYDDGKISVLMPSKKEVKLSGNCRVSVGVIAGSGRTQKPMITAGKQFYKMRARGKLWPRVSAVCVNAIDHPFGSGRGKRIKSKIAKRNSPPGRKVGHLSPSRTGKRK